MGVDPGTHAMGVAVLEGQRLLHLGMIRAKRSAPLPERLATLQAGVRLALEQWAPATVVIEGPAHAKGFQSVASLGAARGVAMAEAVAAGAEVVVVAPTAVKKLVTGRGNAKKPEVAEAIWRRFPQTYGASLDATDAVAIALAADQP